MQLHTLLMNELGLNREQAEGAVGALLQLAQTRLSESDFRLVADCIPAVSDLIGKAPRFSVPERKSLMTKLSRMFGGLGELVLLAAPLARLQIDKQLIPRCAKALQSHFAQNKSAEVATLLGKVWF